MKVALVHDWLTGMRGGERVLERLCTRFPGAPIHTLVWKPGAVSPLIESHPIRTAFIQELPAATRIYRWYLPLFPRAIEAFDLRGYDVVVSSSHCAAKSVRTAPATFHLSYLHTPMRYVYELQDAYFPPGMFPWPVSSVVSRTLARLRRWDIATANRPNAMLCNSAFVAAKIARFYRRRAEVIHPPVDIHRFGAAAIAEARAARSDPAWPETRSGRGAASAPRAADTLFGDPALAHDSIGRPFYLLAGAFAPYKRADLAIRACLQLGRRILVVGTGQDERALRRLAQPGVEFVGWASDPHLAALYRQAQALIFPGEEDFGIVPVEAMASGCPVIAYGSGGAMETVGRGAGEDERVRISSGGVARVPGGVLFGTQSLAGVVDAIQEFERLPFNREVLPGLTEPFSVERFDREFDAAFERHRRAWRDGKR